MSDLTSRFSPAAPTEAGEPVGSPAPLPTASAAPRQLRLWPAVVILACQWLSLLLPGWLAPGTKYQMYSMFLTPVWAAALLLWWLFASRVAWRDRFFILAIAVLGGVAALLVRDLSVPGFALMLWGLPALGAAGIGWLLLTPFLNWPIRRIGFIVAILLVWGFFAATRFDGVDGSFSADWALRWSPSTEDELLDPTKVAESAPSKAMERSTAPASALKLNFGDWPEFRGPRRDGRLAGVQIPTDWKQHPPPRLWSRLVGPGWSSFAVIGTHLYTQEQRGAEERVVCHHTDTGEEIWVHRDKARFTEAMAGAGPRATPTFHEGRIYAQGATGLLNCLDAATGRKLWSADVRADSGRSKEPEWGYAASPLVLEGKVIVYGGGEPGKSVLAYDAASGKLAWAAGKGQWSYCSPQRVRLDGVEQVLMISDVGLVAFRPGDGTVLWEHHWPVEQIARCVQPALVGESDVLLGTGFDMGIRRLHIERGSSGWTDQEVWTTKAIRPYFNDMVLHQDHLYGFDSGGFLTCVALADGQGKWRARGYDSGQVLLLADQGLLLVLTEKTGDVALVEANPEHHKELGRFHALKGKKTWNHPVVAHGKLFVRNGVEMACFDLAGPKNVK